MATNFVNATLQQMRDFWKKLPKGVLSRDDLDDLILHQLEVSAEAERQYRIVEKNRSEYHYMQGAALSEIIAWVERAVGTLELPDLKVERSGEGSLRRIGGSPEPALCFSWMFSSLSDWLNVEKLNAKREEVALV